jgi:hypothetical protein
MTQQIDKKHDPFLGLIELRRFLRAHNIQYALNDWGDDDITVAFATAGSRYEVCFDQETVFWSVFEGGEYQETDLKKMQRRVLSEKGTKTSL